MTVLMVEISFRWLRHLVEIEIGSKARVKPVVCVHQENRILVLVFTLKV